MSEALFDREIRKSQGVEVDEPKALRNYSKDPVGLGTGKKRPPNESDDDKPPDSKRPRKNDGIFIIHLKQRNGWVHDFRGRIK